MRLDHLPESSSSESPDTRERRGAGRRPQGASGSRGAAAERGPRAGSWRGLRRGTRRQGGMTPNASCWAARSWTGETYLVQRPRGRGAGAEGGRVRPAGGFGHRLAPAAPTGRPRPRPPAGRGEHRDSQGPPSTPRPTPPYAGRTGCSAARGHPAPAPAPSRRGASCRPDSREPELRPERCWGARGAR